MYIRQKAAGRGRSPQIAKRQLTSEFVHVEDERVHDIVAAQKGQKHKVRVHFGFPDVVTEAESGQLGQGDLLQVVYVFDRLEHRQLLWIFRIRIIVVLGLLRRQDDALLLGGGGALLRPLGQVLRPFSDLLHSFLYSFHWKSLKRSWNLGVSNSLLSVLRKGENQKQLTGYSYIGHWSTG